MSDKTNQHTHYYKWLIVVSSFFMQFIGWGTNVTFGIFLIPVSLEFSLSRTAISGAYTFGTILRGVLNLFAGKMNDRYGPRVLVIVFGSFIGIGYLLLSQMGALWQLYIFYGVFVSMGMSVTFVPLATTVATWFRVKRGMATAIFLSGASLGGLILAPLTSRLITAYGWRNSYVFIGIISLVIVLFWGLFLKRGPQYTDATIVSAVTSSQDDSSRERGISLKTVVWTEHFWVLCAIMFCSFFCHFTVLVHVVSHSIDLELPARSAATILATCTGMAIPGRVLIGAAADRIGNRQVLMICFGILALDFLWLLQARGFWPLFVFAVVFGLAASVSVVLSSPIVAEMYGLGAHGAILGAVMVSGTTGGAVGPLLAGYIFDTTGDYRVVIAICSSLCVTAMVLTMLLDRRRMRKKNHTAEQ